MLQMIFAENCFDVNDVNLGGSLVLVKHGLRVFQGIIVVLKVTSGVSLLPLGVDKGQLVLGVCLLSNLGTDNDGRIPKIVTLTLRNRFLSLSPFLISISISLLFSMGQ